MEKDQYLLSSTFNSLKILDLLSEHESLGVAEINQRLGLGKTSVFRMLHTLEKAGFIHKSASAKYSLGVKFIRFAAVVMGRLSLVQESRPVLQKLCDEFGETGHLTMLTGSGKIIFLEKLYSGSTVQINSQVGVERDAYLTASGKVMLAFQDAASKMAHADRYDYKPNTGNSIAGKEALLAELTRVREQGYAVDNEEHELGLVCFAAPILDHSGACIAALSLSGPTVRMYRSQEKIIAAVMRAAGEISARFGFRP